MPFKPYLIIALLLAAAVSVRPAGARELTIKSSTGAYDLAPWMEIFEDPEGKLSFEEMVNRGSKAGFRNTPSSALNLGVTTSAFWLRFRIKSGGSSQDKRVLSLGEAFPGRINWELYDEATGGRIADGGSSTAYDTFAILSLHPSGRTYYLRAASTTTLMFHPRLYTYKAFYDHTRLLTLLNGLFYGILLAVGVYNFFLFISFSDYSYLWYVIHLAFSLVYFLGINGFSQPLLAPANPEFFGLINRSFLGAMTASIALMTRSFLMTRRRAPKIDRIILLLFSAACALTVMNLVFPARTVVALLVVAGIVVPLAMALASWRSLRGGFKPAGLFMAAWGFSTLGVIFFALTCSGAIPFTPFGFNGFQAGSALAAILLSLALGHRIRALRQERISFKQSMERLTIILDSMESGVFLIEIGTGRIREINLAAQRIIGRKRHDIIGKRYWEFMGDPDEDLVNAKNNGWKEGRREDSLRNAFGKKIPVLKRAKQIELDGHILILESFVDISDLKQAQEAVQRSEAKFRALFESSRDAVMLLDKGRFVDCNNATLDMFRCSRPDEFLGKSPEDFSPPDQVPDTDSRSQALSHFRKAMTTGSHAFEWHHRRADGEAFPAEVMLSKVQVEGQVMIQALVRDITRHKAMEEKLRLLALTDPLTGARNRRSFLEKGARELGRSRRYGHAFAFLMIDVDHFKTINDTYGHAAGDEVLKALVTRSLSVIRETDVFGRLGGEEFALILPETSPEKAVEAGERLRRTLAALEPDSDQGRIRFTVSLGMAVLEDETDTLTTIMARADKALYRAKERGRNCLVQGS